VTFHLCNRYRLQQQAIHRSEAARCFYDAFDNQIDFIEDCTPAYRYSADKKIALQPTEETYPFYFAEQPKSSFIQPPPKIISLVINGKLRFFDNSDGVILIHKRRACQYVPKQYQTSKIPHQKTH
jgi:hypothetical protein